MSIQKQQQEGKKERRRKANVKVLCYTQTQLMLQEINVKNDHLWQSDNQKQCSCKKHLVQASWELCLKILL